MSSPRLLLSITGSRDATEEGTAKQYTMYELHCKYGDLSWTVLKRYSQFYDLKLLLEREMVRLEVRKATICHIPRKCSFSLSLSKTINTFVGTFPQKVVWVAWYQFKETTFWPTWCLCSDFISISSTGTSLHDTRAFCTNERSYHK